jgi:hypothetical protein
MGVAECEGGRGDVVDQLGEHDEGHQEGLPSTTATQSWPPSRSAPPAATVTARSALVTVSRPADRSCHCSPGPARLPAGTRRPASRLGPALPVPQPAHPTAEQEDRRAPRTLLIELPAAITGEVEAYHSLAVRDLQRGQTHGLPSGEAHSRALGIEPLDIGDAGLGQLGRAGETSLWYYLLKEAGCAAAGTARPAPRPHRRRGPTRHDRPRPRVLPRGPADWRPNLPRPGRARSRCPTC